MQTKSKSDTNNPGAEALVAALPKPIADFVEANARLDVDGMLKPFAADALIVDNGHRHAGHPEIRTLFED